MDQIPINLSKVKVFCSDLDDTLLDDNQKIQPYTKMMLQLLLKSGIHVVFASGRSPDSVSKYTREIQSQEIPSDNQDIPIIALNGGFASVQGIKPYKATLKEDIILKSLEYCEKNNYCIEFYSDENVIISTKDSQYHQYHKNLVGVDGILMSYFEMRQFCLSKPPAKFLICEDPPLIQNKIIPDLSKYLPSTSRILVTKPCFLEVLPSDTTKANALEWLQKCGLSYCPANANEAAKHAAQHILSWTNTQDCVGKLINQIFFDNKYDIGSLSKTIL
ncbi:MAG: hypothetical protein EZS28_001188 [Streblomastix strix]|uniref:Uncharacterized protein n=1 Tax=Streblomastix strix TaxID=222440 RepID=A0A5J4X912_9EUKA|nr:MAG: hypothetical protein EZS28_001188 [Streblomastix strix]